MPRIRTIKPDFWTDEKIVELRPYARLLFIGLWNLCDDHGRMEYSPKRIKLQLFPQDKIDIAQICGELRDIGLIQIYSINEHEYLEVINFSKHQHIKNKDRDSKYPNPPVNTCADNLANTAQIPLEGNGKEGNGKGKEQGAGKPAAQIDAALEIFTDWQTVHRHPNSRLDAKRRKAIEGRLKENYSKERIQQAIRGIKNCPHNMGQNDNKTVYDDIELICRSGANVDRFADMQTPSAGDSQPKRSSWCCAVENCRGLVTSTTGNGPRYCNEHRREKHD